MPDNVAESIVGNLPVIGGIASDIIGAVSQGAQNRKARKFAKEMYGIQRQDALADWRMQADYNSPAAQMQRLKDAGLNPNLVYGHGADAGAPAPVRQSTQGSYQGRPIQTDIGGDLMKYYEVKTQRLMQDNLAAQKTLRDAQTLKATNEAIVAGVKGRMQEKTLERFDEFRDTQLTLMRADTQKRLADKQFTLDENQRQEVMNAPNVKIAWSKLLTMELDRQQTALNMSKTELEKEEIRNKISHIQSQIKNIDSSTELNQIYIQMRRMGINPNAGGIFGVGANIIGNALQNVLNQHKVNEQKKSDQRMDQIKKQNVDNTGKPRRPWEVSDNY